MIPCSMKLVCFLLVIAWRPEPFGSCLICLNLYAHQWEVSYAYLILTQVSSRQQKQP